MKSVETRITATYYIYWLLGSFLNDFATSGICYPRSHLDTPGCRPVEIGSKFLDLQSSELTANGPCAPVRMDPGARVARDKVPPRSGHGPAMGRRILLSSRPTVLARLATAAGGTEDLAGRVTERRVGRGHVQTGNFRGLTRSLHRAL